MIIKETEKSGVTVVHVEGDFLSEPDQQHFQQRIRELAGKGKKKVVIDLGRVKHMNSCGLGSLVCALTTLRKAGGDIRLANMAGGIHDLFIITQLEKIFESSATVEEAIGGFRTTGR